MTASSAACSATPAKPPMNVPLSRMNCKFDLLRDLRGIPTPHDSLDQRRERMLEMNESGVDDFDEVRIHAVEQVAIG